MDHAEPQSAVHYWLDLSAGLGYIAVGVRFNAFRHFLNAIDTLIANPAWKPGTPVLEDLRDCCSSSIESSTMSRESAPRSSKRLASIWSAAIGSQ